MFHKFANGQGKFFNTDGTSGISGLVPHPGTTWTWFRIKLFVSPGASVNVLSTYGSPLFLFSNTHNQKSQERRKSNASKSGKNGEGMSHELVRVEGRWSQECLRSTMRYVKNNRSARTSSGEVQEYHMLFAVWRTSHWDCVPHTSEEVQMDPVIYVNQGWRMGRCRSVQLEGNNLLCALA